MKYIIITIIFFFTTLVRSQDFKILEVLKSRDSLTNGKAVIYGNFIQRLGFTSGGFPQDIRLLNIETKEILAFRVKATLKSAKENTFIYFIEPGNYAILNYWWTDSKWYGGKIYTEPIFSGIDTFSKIEDKLSSEELNANDFKRFTFSITENSFNYLGTWHFDKPIVTFTDDKAQFDAKIKSKFKKLDFSLAKSILPN